MLSDSSFCWCVLDPCLTLCYEHLTQYQGYDIESRQCHLKYYISDLFWLALVVIWPFYNIWHCVRLTQYQMPANTMSNSFCPVPQDNVWYCNRNYWQRGPDNVKHCYQQVQWFLQAPNTMLQVAAGLAVGGVKTMSNITSAIYFGKPLL